LRSSSACMAVLVSSGRAFEKAFLRSMAMETPDRSASELICRNLARKTRAGRRLYEIADCDIRAAPEDSSMNEIAQRRLRPLWLTRGTRTASHPRQTVLLQLGIICPRRGQSGRVRRSRTGA
jgi:hypothetical protein